MTAPRRSAPDDVGTLFARAEAAFVAGRAADARADLHQVQRLAGDHPAVLHLTALVEKRLGHFKEADNAFRRALTLAPGDGQIHGNYANLLDAAGKADAALLHYGRSITAAPHRADVRLNRALLLIQSGRPAEALGDLDAAAAVAAPSARLLTTRGAALRDLDRLGEAAAALDAALLLEPGRPQTLALRARVALERGEPDASERYRLACAAVPADAELRLGLALALEAEADDAAVPAMAALVAEHPGWTDAHEQLARMRGEAGDDNDPGRSYRAALSERPADVVLHRSHWYTLIRAERHQDALAAIDVARRTIADDETLLIAEAVAADELGDTVRADAAFARLGDAAAAVLPRARRALRRGEPAEATRLLDPLVRSDADDVAAWAYLALAWRQLDDPRAAWLCEQPNLVATHDLGYSAAELDGVAAFLRTLHKTRAHPIGQSLRGGTQTRGRLLTRDEPRLVELRRRLEPAVAAHVSALPAKDLAHPLLRHRDQAFALAGSWSVRLCESGFHLHHIHPQGILSSAFYVALPCCLGDPETRAGWLELGAPPRELGLDLEPIRTIRPQAGTLALFPSYLFHGTRPFRSGERLTVAFDVRAA